MAETTGISWCNSTWNCWRGCLKVSEGCARCYADTLAKRNPSVLGVWGPSEAGGTRVVAAEAYWKEPLKWERRAAASGEPWRVFCASLADVFEDWHGPMTATTGAQWWKRADGSWTTSDHYRDTVALTLDDVRARAFAVMVATPHLTWLVLTKRPENILRLVPPAWLESWPANVWPGTTTENQARADERVPELLKVPAAVRWLSVEPQIGPVDLSLWIDHAPERAAERRAKGGSYYRESIHWAITGGESGPGARPYRLEWARSLVAQCREAGVPCFVKQLGANPAGDELFEATGRVRRDAAGNMTKIELRRTITDKMGGDPSEWPEDLRVRQFPEVSRA